MNKLAIVLAIGAAALIGGSAASAADNAAKSKPMPGVTQSSTDISARKRHRHSSHRHWRHHSHWGHGHYRPHYRSYGYYAPRPYGYYGPRYYGGGPGITFSFGTGGYRGWY